MSFQSFIASRQVQALDDLDEKSARDLTLEIQELSLRLEQLASERAKLEVRRERLELELLSRTDRSLIQARHEEIAKRAGAARPPKRTKRCRYCKRHTPEEFGGDWVCSECQVQVDYINAMEDAADALDS